MRRTDAEIAAICHSLLVNGELTLSERVLAALYLYHEGVRDLSRTEICTLLAIGPSSYHRANARLTDLGIIERSGRGAGLAVTTRISLGAPVISKIAAAYEDLRSQRLALSPPDRPVEVSEIAQDLSGKSHQGTGSPLPPPCTVVGPDVQNLRSKSHHSTGSPPKTPILPHGPDSNISSETAQNVMDQSHHSTGLSHHSTGSPGVHMTTRARAGASSSSPIRQSKKVEKEEGGRATKFQPPADLFAPDEMEPEGVRINGTKIVWVDPTGTERTLSFRILETRINSGGKASDPVLLREWAQGEIDVGVARGLEGDLIGWLTHRLNKTSSFDDWLERRPKPKGKRGVKLFGDDEKLVAARDNWDTLVHKGG